MPKALSLARCRVPSELETEYLATVRELARLVGRRGERLWVFRSRQHAHTFVECTESASVATHRTVAERPVDEVQLERRLRQLAQYERDAWELWEEVPLVEPPGP